jgi:hypothetical protein
MQATGWPNVVIVVTETQKNNIISTYRPVAEWSSGCCC